VRTARAPDGGIRQVKDCLENQRLLPGRAESVRTGT